jgi:DNA-binding LytR/AlgR family response regulator
VAAHADEALTLLHGRPDVRVLFTDVNMPGTMDGVQLAHVARQQWPRLAIIVTSGRGATGVLPPDASFIMKPYTPSALVELIAGILRSPAEPIIFTRLERGATKTSGAPVLPGPVNLDGLNMGNGTTSGLAQPLAGGDE